MITPSDHIRKCIEQEQWDLLTTLFQRLSNAEFRRAEQTIRQNILPTLPNDAFWAALLHLIKYREQAFISGIMCIGHLADDGTLRFSSPEALQLAQLVSETQVLKMMDMAVPFLRTEEQVNGLFHLFHVDDERQQIRVLLRLHTPLAYFLIFKLLCHATDSRELALLCCKALQKRGDDLSYNMVSILREYFGLTEIHSQLSLHIEPYELSYLDQSYERFCYALEGKKPKII